MTAATLPSRAVASEIARQLGSRFRFRQRDDGYYVIEKQTALGWRALSRRALERALSESGRPN